MNFGDALRLLTRLESCDLDIVEQPLPAWDLDGMAALARTIRIPLSADESLTDEHSLLSIAQRGAARVVQTKSAKNGGIDATRRLWDIAHASGIGIFPGNHPSTGINVAAVAHLAAAAPYRLLVGDFQTGCVDMIAEDILAEPIRVESGKLQVPRGPGFGVEIDPDKLARYRIDGA
jgi:muconate cycloisomerase